MKPIQEQRIFETFGDEESTKRQFKIQQSKEAFKILSSGVYSDKILAVIREYSANAWDSHKVAKKLDKKFIVHLPNTFEPWFSVRDFGLGMSEENIYELFTTYFSSSKRLDNEATGFLGIGSKSAFAYTDQFTVTSWFDGKKSVYTCFISDEGTPEVSLVHAEPTAEENGLEIKMAVHANDYSSFSSKAAGLFRFWKNPPEIVGNPACTWVNNNVTKEFKLSHGCVFREYDTGYAPHSLWIVQGACSYNINVNLVPQSVQNVYKILKGVLEVPIGTVNITASREHLEYDKHTLKVLEVLGIEIKDLITKDFQDEIKELKTEWQTTVYANKNRARPFWNLVNNTVVFGKPLTYWSGYVFEANFVEKTGKNLKNAPNGKDILDGNGNPIPELNRFATPSTFYVRDLDKKSLKGYEYSGPLTIYPNRALTKIVINDTGRSRYKEVLQHNKVFFETAIPDVDTYKFYYVSVPDLADLPKVMKALSFIEAPYDKAIILLSTLPEPPKTVGAKSKPVSIHKMEHGRWKDAKRSPSDGGVYVRTTRLYPDSYAKSNGTLKDLLLAAYNAGLLTDTSGNHVDVYGIPKSFENIPKKHTGWIELTDYLKDQISKRIKGVNFVEMFKQKREKEFEAMSKESVELLKLFKGSSKYVDKFLDTCDTFKAIPDDKLWNCVEVLRQIAALEEDTSDPVLKSISDAGKELTILEKQLSILKRKYSLLFNYRPRSYDAASLLNDWKHYIKAIDALEELNQAPSTTP